MPTKVRVTINGRSFMAKRPVRSKVRSAGALKKKMQAQGMHPALIRNAVEKWTQARR